MTAVLFDIEVEERRIALRPKKIAAGIAIAAIVALLGTAGYLRSPASDVDQVVLQGTHQVSFGEVLETTGVYKSQMMDVDPLVMQKQLEALPWVWRAEVHRDWPNTVYIKVIERVPAANVAGDNGQWMVVDATGRVLTSGSNPMPALPVIQGLGTAGEVGTTIGEDFAPGLEVAALMPTELALTVTAVAIQPDGSVQLALPGGQIALLGPSTEVEAKLTALATVLGRVDLSGVTTVDVRVPNAPVLIRPVAGD